VGCNRGSSYSSTGLVVIPGVNKVKKERKIISISKEGITKSHQDHRGTYTSILLGRENLKQKFMVVYGSIPNKTNTTANPSGKFHFIVSKMTHHLKYQ
jgi:hypothetical protein